MSASIGPTSIFVSTPRVGTPGIIDDAWYKANGVDPDLDQQYNSSVPLAAYNKSMLKDHTGLDKYSVGWDVMKSRQDWLNNLTPDQLKVNAGVQMMGWDRNRNYSWQEVKDWTNASMGLEGAAMSREIFGVDQSKDPALNQIWDLFNDLNQNKPGALARANSYLAANPDQITLSPDASSVIAKGSASAKAAALQRQQLLAASASDNGPPIALAVLKAAQTIKVASNTDATESVDDQTKASKIGTFSADKVSGAITDSVTPSVDFVV